MSVFLIFQVHTSYLRNLLDADSAFVGLEGGADFCISNRVSGDAETPFCGPYFR